MYIKGFDSNLTCRGFQFKVGKEYKTSANPNNLKLNSEDVFHFADCLFKVEEFYKVRNSNNRFCEIEVLGNVIYDHKKMGSNHIKIIREINKQELEKLINLTMDFPESFGMWNLGYDNLGNCNIGNSNFGSHNIGCRNIGSHNEGNYNISSNNKGSYNIGYNNFGSYNRGSFNQGNSNLGNSNNGYCNVGNYNQGNYNLGSFNLCDNSNGFFCTEEPKIAIFNMQTNMTLSEFRETIYYEALNSVKLTLTEWCYYTNDEKINNHEEFIRYEKTLTQGYLKTLSFTQACQIWWDKITEQNKEIIKSMPGFDKDIFCKITGILVN